MEFPNSAIPAPGELRRAREEIGISQQELSSALGFGPNGARTIRSWEDGWRDGEVFKPTATAWAAFRYLIALVAAYRRLHPADPVRLLLEPALPDVLKGRSSSSNRHPPA